MAGILEALRELQTQQVQRESTGKQAMAQEASRLREGMTINRTCIARNAACDTTPVPASHRVSHVT